MPKLKVADKTWNSFRQCFCDISVSGIRVAIAGIECAIYRGLAPCRAWHFGKEDRMSIRRLEVGPRMSDIVVHGNTVYLAGQVGEGDTVEAQTRDILATVDQLLAQVGSDKTKILQTIIWLADISTFAEMNAVWDAWVPQGHTPARATGEAKLANPKYKVEMIVTAAI
jgi:enamine deaminase RidA (YjgF/YER057c/UK114 family)